MDSNPSSFRASKLEPWEVEAADRLKAIFKAKSTLSQKAFGARFEIGSGGMVSQYLNKQRPLGLKTAIKFAKGLGVPVSDISQHLAAQLPKDGDPGIGQKYERASPEVRQAIDDLVDLPPDEAAKLAVILKNIRATYGPQS